MQKLTKQSGLALIVLAATFSTGCTDRVGSAEQKMQEIRNQPAQPIQPPPQAEIVEDFVYSASNLRSPFIPPSLVNAQNLPVSNEGVRPDATREKEPLEKYELSELTYRGSVISPEGQLFGLVQLPDGTIASVKVGDYLGVNDGRIVEITSTQINLIEIVPDGRVGYIEKPESLVSPAG